jgi:PPP family 3-phenylpropionic acid transporter
MIEILYFCYFQAVGIYLPYFGAYLRGLGLTGREISTILSMTPLLAITTPLAWAYLADRTKRHATILRAVSLGACLGFLPVVFSRSFGGVLLGWTMYAVFNAPVTTLADSLAIARVRAGADYGRMRQWGSLGYIVAALACGALLTARGARVADPLMPAAMALGLAATFLASVRLRGTGETKELPRFADAASLLRDRRFRLLLLAGPLHWAACVPYNVYFGILVRELHLSPLHAGASFCIGVAAEMLVLLRFRKLRERFRLEDMIALSFAATAARWLAVSVVHSTFVLMALQVLHGLTFGLFWGAGIALVAETVPPALRATGQAVFMIALNLGTEAGYAATGVIYDAAGPRVLFLYAAAVEVVPLVLALRARRAAAAAPLPDPLTAPRGEGA